MTIPQLIKSDRERKGLTQKQYGEQIGISDSYLSNIESGRKQPTIETLDKILSVIGLGSVEVLVNNELKKRNDKAN